MKRPKKNTQIFTPTSVLCPHCRYEFRSSIGSGHKRLGPSYRHCPKCNGMYNDIDYYEWSLLTPIYKLFFYFLANNRVFGLLPSFIYLVLDYNIDEINLPLPLLILSFLWPFACFFYIRYRYKDEMIASKQRTENNPKYVALLQQHEDPFLFRYDFYKTGPIDWKELIKDAFSFD